MRHEIEGLHNRVHPPTVKPAEQDVVELVRLALERRDREDGKEG